jgi:hypothetical protein
MSDESKPVPAVYKAVAAVMATLAKDGIQKDRNNAQQGYKFRGIDDVYNALAPALIAAGLIVVPSYTMRTCEERITKKESVLFYVNVVGTFRLIAVADGSEITAGPFCGEAMDTGDKATNKAMSASYKYWAMQTFAIPTDADNDADATTHNDVRPNTATQVAKDAFVDMSDEQKDYLSSHAKEMQKLFDAKGDLLGYVEKQRFDTEEKLAIWSLLPSDLRAEFKRQQSADRISKKPTPAQYASQA